MRTTLDERLLDGDDGRGLKVKPDNLAPAQYELALGARVRIHGLKGKPELNGLGGEVVGRVDKWILEPTSHLRGAASRDDPW